MTHDNIAILNYHKIEPKADIGLTARHPDDFKRDLEIIKELAFQPVTFQDLLQPSFKAHQKPLIITFDDGYQSVIEFAFPLLKELGMKAVVFMPTGFIGRTNDWDIQLAGKKYQHLSRQELRFLADSGFEIGSHGVSHRAFTTLSPKQCLMELRQSKQTLEEIIGRSVISISYPFGQFSKPILELSHQQGYRFGVGSIYYFKLHKLDGLSSLALRRFNVYRFDSPKALYEKLQGNYNSFYAYRDWLIQRGGQATIFWQKLFKRSR